WTVCCLVRRRGPKESPLRQPSVPATRRLEMHRHPVWIFPPEPPNGLDPMKRKRNDSLVFSTVPELIEELVSRATFVGVVVASDKEHKGGDTVHDTFTTYASLNNPDQVITILKTVASNIEAGQS